MERSWEPWFVLFLFSILIVFTWSAIEPAVCPVPALFLNADQIKDKISPPCIEYWLNRYQTLIGAVVALIAAFIAWHGVSSQIVELKAQTRAATVQMSANQASIMTEIVESMNRISAVIDEIEHIEEFSRQAMVRAAHSAHMSADPNQAMADIGSGAITHRTADSMRKSIADLGVAHDRIGKAIEMLAAERSRLHQIEIDRLLDDLSGDCIRTRAHLHNMRTALENYLGVITENPGEEFYITARRRVVQSRHNVTIDTKSIKTIIMMNKEQFFRRRSQAIDAMFR